MPPDLDRRRSLPFGSAQPPVDNNRSRQENCHKNIKDLETETREPLPSGLVFRGLKTNVDQKTKEK